MNEPILILIGTGSDPASVWRRALVGDWTSGGLSGVLLQLLMLPVMVSVGFFAWSVLPGGRWPGFLATIPGVVAGFVFFRVPSWPFWWLDEGRRR
jgi:hypothetical protein